MEKPSFEELHTEVKLTKSKNDADFVMHHCVIVCVIVTKHVGITAPGTYFIATLVRVISTINKFFVLLHLHLSKRRFFLCSDLYYTRALVVNKLP